MDDSGGQVSDHLLHVSGARPNYGPSLSSGVWHLYKMLRQMFLTSSCSMTSPSCHSPSCHSFCRSAGCCFSFGCSFVPVHCVPFVLGLQNVFEVVLVCIRRACWKFDVPIKNTVQKNQTTAVPTFLFVFAMMFLAVYAYVVPPLISQHNWSTF